MIKKLTLIALSAGTLFSSAASAQAPSRALVLASQPRIILKTDIQEKCLQLTGIDKEGQPMSPERLRAYIGVGALIGGVVLGAATQNYSTVTTAGAQLGATALGMLGGGYLGKKVAEAQAPQKSWAFDDGAGQAPAKKGNCTVLETVNEIQQGYSSLVRIRGEDVVLHTDEQLKPGAEMRAFLNGQGQLELVP